jgi:riboflavin kinase/FMN adenylyltransferase
VRLYRSLQEIADLGGRPRAVAIGVFDGVHLGHRRIVREAVRAAADMAGMATVLTFEPHPLSFLKPEEAPPILTPLSMKLDLLESEGVQETAALPFDASLASVSPGDFCRELLAARLGARQVVVGANFRFGAKGAGTPEDLLSCGAANGFSVKTIELVQSEGESVSSTRIRQLLGQGEVGRVLPLLGRAHTVAGYVEAGAGRGRDLGVPTANLALSPQIMLPALGVYVTRTTIAGGRREHSITSVGTNPTFENDGRMRVESFLLDYTGNLYGRHIAVEFLARLRGQLTFSSPKALVEQMWSDIAAARAYFLEPAQLVEDPLSGHPMTANSGLDGRVDSE